MNRVSEDKLNKDQLDSKNHKKIYDVDIGTNLFEFNEDKIEKRNYNSIRKYKKKLELKQTESINKNYAIISGKNFREYESNHFTIY